MKFQVQLLNGFTTCKCSVTFELYSDHSNLQYNLFIIIHLNLFQLVGLNINIDYINNWIGYSHHVLQQNGAYNR